MLGEWRKLTFKDPAKALHSYRAVQEAVSRSNVDAKLKNLRTNSLKPEREAWHLALFSYLVSKSLNFQVFYSEVEDSDYDGVCMWVKDETQNFAPVQLKELVPSDLNPTSSIQKIISKLKKYTDSKDLIVAVKMTRNFTLKFEEFDLTGLNIKQLWLFGATEPEQNN
ncbi:MAG: hypothetical protein KUG78_06780 [Kangiellaceae bacterium]|nr:hypothetical protein [Kangiellaceae bacterium]